MGKEIVDIIRKEIGHSKTIAPLEEGGSDLDLFMLHNLTMINRSGLIKLNKEKLRSVFRSESLIEFFDEKKREMVFMCSKTKETVRIKVKKHYKFLISPEGELSLYIDSIKI